MKADWLISGPSYTMFSPKAEIQKSVNCFRQKVESGLGGGAFVLMRSPGLVPIPGVLSSGVGTFRSGFELNDNVFTIKGGVGYVFDRNFSIIAQYAPISNLNNSWIRTAHSVSSILFVSDRILYRAAAGNVLQIPDAGPPDPPGTPINFVPQDVAFIDNYFVVVDAGIGVGPSDTGQDGIRLFWSSNDGQNFRPDAFQFVPGVGSVNVAVITHLGVLYVYTNRYVIPFIVGTNPNAPFEPQQSGIINYGLQAYASLQTLGNARYWLSRNQDGQGIVVRGQGYSVQKVSDLGVDAAILDYTKRWGTDDAIGMTYQMGGQEFYRITFPAANDNHGATWEFNATLGEWNELTWTNFRTSETWRHRANVLVSAFGKTLAGDFENGWLYEMVLAQDVPRIGRIVTDAGFPIYGNRRAPHIQGDADHRAFYDELVLGAETGVGLLAPLWLQSYKLDRATFTFFIGDWLSTGFMTQEQYDALLAIYDQTPYIPQATSYLDAEHMAELGFVPWGAAAVRLDGTWMGGPPTIAMAYSNDGGMSYKARLERSLGRAGEFRQVRWSRQGIARDRVYDFTWQHPCVQNLTTSWIPDVQQTPS